MNDVTAKGPGRIRQGLRHLGERLRAEDPREVITRQDLPGGVEMLVQGIEAGFGTALDMGYLTVREIRRQPSAGSAMLYEVCMNVAKNVGSDGPNQGHINEPMRLTALAVGDQVLSSQYQPSNGVTINSTYHKYGHVEALEAMLRERFESYAPEITDCSLVHQTETNAKPSRTSDTIFVSARVRFKRGIPVEVIDPEGHPSMPNLSPESRWGFGRHDYRTVQFNFRVDSNGEPNGRPTYHISGIPAYILLEKGPMFR